MPSFSTPGQLLSIPLEFLLDVVRFPYWWYSGGLKDLLSWVRQSFKEARQRLALGIFARSFFKPMYQDYSWQGRLISLAARFFILILKLVRWLGWCLFYGLIIILWLVLLPLIIYMLVR